MLNNLLVSLTLPFFSDYCSPSVGKPRTVSKGNSEERHLWQMAGGAAFLVSVPVFFQAPLVRLFPLASLLLTVGWAGLAISLMKRTEAQRWGDLLWGFTWSWLAGSIYWGWLRWEPLIHLPIEAIGVPFAIWGLRRGWCKIGHWFYLGSLLGTTITDLYFYVAGLIPYWREVVRIDPTLAEPILQGAIAQAQTPWGVSWAIALAIALFGVGLWAIQQQQSHWWAFAGAVLSTIVVDGLFGLVVSLL
ncbi:DUF3120 domain-containing protein [Lusitaniella coriacea]|uniref:DUF3120 domain-containing protein n=1 Tax=Lusitaniella coriacea TaxID=1983105 RepID=UPI003CE9F997